MIETFPNSPVTEALIDIRVEQSKRVDAQLLETCHDALRDSYPTKKVRRLWEGKFEFRAGQTPVASAARDDFDGIQFWSSDEKQVVQFRTEGFSFSRLRPYTRWEQMHIEAMKYWNVYIQGINPISVKRLAVRYINLIEIPEAKFELAEYFTSPPKLADNIECEIAHFTSRFVIQMEGVPAKAIVTMTVAPKTKAGSTGIIFDLDVYRDDMHIKTTDPEISNVLENLRTAAYSIFEKSTSDRCKELFR